MSFGAAWHDWDWHGAARHGSVRQCPAWRGLARGFGGRPARRRANVHFQPTKLDTAWSGKAACGLVRHGVAGSGVAREFGAALSAEAYEDAPPAKRHCGRAGPSKVRLGAVQLGAVRQDAARCGKARVVARRVPNETLHPFITNLSAWRGTAQYGPARRDKARIDGHGGRPEVPPPTSRHGSAGRGMARLGRAWLGKAG